MAAHLAEEPERREFQRMLAWSALGHVVALAFALVSPGSVKMSSPQVIAVELVAPPSTSVAVRPQAPSPPAPKPAAPEPAPPEPVPLPPEPAKPTPPVPEAVLLPEKPTAPVKPEPKPEPRPEPRREEVFRVPEEKQPEKSLEDLMAEMRRDAGETAADKAPEAAAPPAGPVDTASAPSHGVPDGSPLSAEEREWHARVKRKMKGVWVVPPGFRTQPLETWVEVELDASGRMIGDPRITQRSGNPWFDEGVVRGLTKASPLPAPPEAGTWPMVFRPGDSL